MKTYKTKFNNLSLNSFMKKIPGSLIMKSVVFVLSICLSAWAFKVRRWEDLYSLVPIGGDGMLVTFYFNVIRSLPWLKVMTLDISTLQYGWPFKFDSSFYPFGNYVETLIIKLFLQLFPNMITEQALFFFVLLRCGVAATCFYFLLSYFTKDKTVLLIFSTIFGISNFSLVRGLGHFLLGFTWSIPLALAVILRLIDVSHSIDGNRSLNKKTSYFLLLICGLSGFYSVTFTILCILIMTLILVFSEPAQQEQTEFRLSGSLLKLKLKTIPILQGLFFLLLGFLLQIAPPYIRSYNLSLTKISERSMSESVVYSGNTESLFFGIYESVFRLLGRFDMLNFVSSRLSWEGSQVSLVVQILILCFPLFLIFLSAKEFRSALAIRIRMFPLFGLKSIFTLFFLCIFMYFHSPLNWFLSLTILNPIRAWGRISIVISTLGLVLLAIAVSSLNSRKTRIASLAFILLISTTELVTFRSTRPELASLRQVAIQNRANAEHVIHNLNELTTKNCPIASVPAYPFPEFDVPYDKNSDYASLELATLTKNYYRWSIAGIKGSSYGRFLEGLTSETPPFARANLSTQLYAASLWKPCAVLIDQTLLSPSEGNELSFLANQLESSPQKCLQSLDVGKSLSQARYIAFSPSQKCIKFINVTEADRAIVLENMNLSKKGLLWKQYPSDYYRGAVPVVSGEKNIELKLKNVSDETLALRIHSRGKALLSGERIKFCDIVSEESLGMNCIQASHSQTFEWIIISLKPGANQTKNFKCMNCTKDDEWGVTIESLNAD